MAKRTSTRMRLKPASGARQLSQHCRDDGFRAVLLHQWSYCRRDEAAIRDFLAWLKLDLEG
ncbi:hypothetical protein [Stappia indica]|uniref:hypothetical protein n=1 Tax=Stappia indica TaxID=538381 RepID=UPI000BE29C21|nr:hypothetical protein [Stappia indica]